MLILLPKVLFCLHSSKWLYLAKFLSHLFVTNSQIFILFIHVLGNFLLAFSGNCKCMDLLFSFPLRAHSSDWYLTHSRHLLNTSIYHGCSKNQRTMKSSNLAPFCRYVKKIKFTYNLFTPWSKIIQNTYTELWSIVKLWMIYR